MRNIVFYKNFFYDFYDLLSEKTKRKVDYVLNLISQVERVPSTYLKHMEGADGLFEIRVQFGNDIFRFFCFFDESNTLVVMNGFQKKTNKTPAQEIEKAQRIKKSYFEEKKKGDTP